MPDVIQLTIWESLTLAANNSVRVDFLGLLADVDESIDCLMPADRLSAAGEAIRRLGEIYADRSAMQRNYRGWLRCLLCKFGWDYY